MRSHLLALVSLLLVSMSGYTGTMGSPARAQALLWATQAGGTSIDEGLGIATTERGDSYVTGFFNQGTATFGQGEPNETTLTSAGGSAIFVAKYDRDGRLVWATQAGGAGSDLGRGVSATERGDSYVTGHFSGMATFGQGEPSQTTLTSAGNLDIFVAKYDRDGRPVWATQAGGGAGSDEGFGIATTQRGDSYVTGFFGGTATFGQGEPNETTLTSAGDFDIFVAKYDRDGRLVWATQAGGGDGIDEGLGIATTERGDSYVTGFFRGMATFGQGEPSQTTLTSAGNVDIFVAKYDRDGRLVWATQAVGGAGSDEGLGIATTERGDSYVTGFFGGTATFGQGEPNETTLTSAGNEDIFVAKYDRDGRLVWATQAGGGTSIEEGLGIATTERGDSYVTGYFTDMATFGQGEPNETTLTSAGNEDIFVAKYDRDGRLVRATRAGGTGNFDFGSGIATTQRGDSYVTGFFTGMATFGQGEPSQTTLTSAGNLDIFVAKYR